MPRTSTPGTSLGEIIEDKPLAASHIQNLHAGLDAVMGDQVVGHDAPAAVIFVSAITGIAAAIPIVIGELDRQLGDLCLVALVHAGQIIARGGFVDFRDEINVGHKTLCSQGLCWYSRGIWLMAAQLSSTHWTTSDSPSSMEILGFQPNSVRALVESMT